MTRYTVQSSAHWKEYLWLACHSLSRLLLLFHSTLNLCTKPADLRIKLGVSPLLPSTQLESVLLVASYDTKEGHCVTVLVMGVWATCSCHLFVLSGPCTLSQLQSLKYNVLLPGLVVLRLSRYTSSQLMTGNCRCPWRPVFRYCVCVRAQFHTRSCFSKGIWFSSADGMALQRNHRGPCD